MKRLALAAAAMLISTNVFASTPAIKCAQNYFKVVDKVIAAYVKAGLAVCKSGTPADSAVGQELVDKLNKFVATYMKKLDMVGGACDDEFDNVGNTFKFGPSANEIVRLGTDSSMFTFQEPAHGSEVINYLKTACDAPPPP